MANYRFDLKNLIPASVMLSAMECVNNVEAAEYITEQTGIEVTRQNVRYWRLQHENAKGKQTFNKAAANRELKESFVPRTPTPNDDAALHPVYDPEREYRAIMVIPDLHTPYHHPDSFEFLRWVRDQYLPDIVVNLGDETDGHAISFHNSDPNLDSAGVELEKARAALSILEADFPNLLLMHSNHGSLVYRKAKAHGLPVEFIRPYREVLFPEGNGQGWQWMYDLKLHTPQGPVLFKHQATGDVLSAAAHEGLSLVVGHSHSKFEIQYGASSQRLYYGVTSGCLIDKQSLAFAYGKDFPKKPIIGCTVILEGIPVLIPMHLDSSGRWTLRSK